MSDQEVHGPGFDNRKAPRDVGTGLVRTDPVAAGRKGGSVGKRTPELEDLILERLSTSTRSLRRICQDDDIPVTHGAVCQWAANDPLFGRRYWEARRVQAMLLHDEILEIADDGLNDTYVTANGRTFVQHDVIARSKLRVDTRRWLLRVMHPRFAEERYVHVRGKVDIATWLASQPPEELARLESLPDDELAQEFESRGLLTEPAAAVS